MLTTDGPSYRPLIDPAPSGTKHSGDSVRILDVVTAPLRGAKRARARKSFHSTAYWESRYREGGTSGDGSYDKLAAYKADLLNDFVRSNDVQTVIEWGAGDGAQAARFDFPAYLGVDVSATAVARCTEAFAGDPTRRFALPSDVSGETADLALSLDVIYHLVEDATFDAYMRDLFASAHRFVIVYSSNYDEQPSAVHVRHRCFTDWVETHAPEWPLKDKHVNPYPYTGDTTAGSFADFYVFERI